MINVEDNILFTINCDTTDEAEVQEALQLCFDKGCQITMEEYEKRIAAEDRKWSCLSVVAIIISIMFGLLIGMGCF